MSKIKWTEEDFNVFQIDGLEQRMNALIEIVRPKFHALGEHFSTYFSGETGLEFFPHVAKHARRTVNPPKDSWVAFAPYKRGYKAIPHFQIGLWETHLFIVVAVIYEAPQKAEMAKRLLENKQIFKTLPNNFVISGDQMSPEGKQITEAELTHLLERLRDVKKGEFVVGLHIPQDKAVTLSETQFYDLAEETFNMLLPIYNVMTSNKVPTVHI